MFGMRIRLALIALVTLGALPLAAPAGVAAQAANSHVLLGNLEVTWGDPWSKREEGSERGDGAEQVQLMGLASVVLVKTRVPAVPAEQMRDEMLGRYETQAPVERVNMITEGSVSMSLEIIRYPDGPFGMIVFVQEDPGGTQMLVFGAAVPDFAAELASAQAGITVSGMPFLGSLDGGQMQQQLEAASAQAPAAGATETPVAGGEPSGTLTGGESVPLGESTYEGAPIAPPIVLPQSARTIAWQPEWYGQESEEGYLSLWSPTARAALYIYDMGWAYPDAAVFAQAQVDHWASQGQAEWGIVSAVDVVPGSRFAVVLSRTHGAVPLYEVYDVRIDGERTSVTMLSAWAPDLTGALDAARQGVTASNAPILADLTLPMDLSAVSPSDPSAFTMFGPGVEVRWTGEWAELRTYLDRLELSSGEDAFPQVAVLEIADAGQSAEDWAATFASPGSGYVQNLAMDLDNGQRMVIVLNGASLSPVSTTYLFISIDRTTSPMLLQAVEVDREDAAAQVAWAQANVTVNGQPVFADVTTVFPELFGEGGDAGQTGTTTPEAGIAGQPAATTPEGDTTPAPGTGNSDQAPAESLAIGYDDWEVTWAGGWESVYDDMFAVFLWHPGARTEFVVQEVLETSHAGSADALAAEQLEMLNADASGVDWVVESATDLDNGQRYYVVLSRTTDEGTLYLVVDEMQQGDSWLNLKVKGWDPGFASRLALLQGSVTIMGARPFDGLDLAAFGTADVPAEVTEDQHTLFSSSRTITWSTDWTLDVVGGSTVVLNSADDAVRFRARDNGFSRAQEYTAATWAANEAEGLRSSGMGEVTIHHAIDADEGQRLVIVLSYVDDGVPTVYVSQAVKADANFEVQALWVDVPRLVSGIAEVQAGITVDGQPALSDILTLIPELATGTLTVPPAGAHTVPADGIALTWTSGEWQLDQTKTTQDQVMLTSVGNPSMQVGYHVLNLPLEANAVDADSYAAWLLSQPGHEAYRLIGAVDVTDPDGTPVWVIVTSFDTGTGVLYHFEVCRMTPGASGCAVGIVPFLERADNMRLVADTVMIAGQAPLSWIEEEFPDLFS
jgi:hypothetical protein